MATQDIKRRGVLLVLSSPSGAGKTAISQALLAREDMLEMSVSVTTRPMRPNEVDGEDYRFIDINRFERLVKRDDLLEHATVFGHRYGTPRGPVESTLSSGRDVLFDIDWQGTQQLAQHAPDDVVSIFVLPPSMAELSRRLESRAQDSAEVVASRMARAADEISHWAEYGYVIVNRDLDQSVTDAQTILHAERLRRKRRTDLVPFVRELTADE